MERSRLTEKLPEKEAKAANLKALAMYAILGAFYIIQNL